MSRTVGPNCRQQLSEAWVEGAKALIDIFGDVAEDCPYAEQDLAEAWHEGAREIRDIYGDSDMSNNPYEDEAVPVTPQYPSTESRKPMTCSPENILWLDFETTGLMTNPATVPLEGAAIITDANLNELATLDSIVIHASPYELSAMDNYVHGMHSKTGLLERVRASTVTQAEFDIALRDFAGPYFPSRGEILADDSTYRGIVIGGNSVKFDFDVIEKFFPETRATIDYRVIDISGVGELVKRWNRPAWEAMPAKLSDHTAMMDIREGVKELRYYRQVLGA